MASALLASCGITTLDLDQTGEVRFVEVEGGCWGISTADELFEPLNLPERFKVDGLPVRFRANRVLDMASICQIGPIIQLESIDSIP